MMALRDMGWIGALLLGVWLAVSASAQTAPAVMPGQYACTGENADGSAYTIPLTVLPDSKQWRLTWHDQPGVLIGLGYFHRGVLSVAIATAKGQPVGLVVYDVLDQTLDGTWMAFGSDALLSERCTPAGAAQAEVR